MLTIKHHKEKEEVKKNMTLKREKRKENVTRKLLEQVRHDWHFLQQQRSVTKFLYTSLFALRAG